MLMSTLPWLCVGGAAWSGRSWFSASSLVDGVSTKYLQPGVDLGVSQIGVPIRTRDMWGL